MIFDNPAAMLMTTLVVCYGTTFLHELGHAMMCRPSGFVPTSFGIGIGRPFWVVGWRGTRIYFGRTRPFQGLTFSWMPQVFPSRAQLIGMLAGGILAHALLMATALTAWWLLPSGRDVWLLIAAINAVMGVTNALPLTVPFGRGYAFYSDGAHILHVWRTGSLRGSPAGGIQAVEALRGLWESIGDTRALAAHLLSAALNWAELGDAEHAGHLLAEAETLSAGSAPALVALLAAARGDVATDPAAAEVALAQAESAYRALGHEAGLFYVDWIRATRRLRSGDAPGAVAALDALAAHPLLARRPAIRDAMLASRLIARAALPDAVGLDALEAEYRAARRRRAAPARDLRVFEALARRHDRLGDPGTDASAYREALAAALGLNDDWPVPAEHERFRRAQAGLIAAAREALVRAGHVEEADAVDAQFIAPEVRAGRIADARHARNRCYARVGWWLTVADVLGSLGLLGFATLFVRTPGRWEFGGMLIALGVVMGLFAVLAALLGLALIILGRLIPSSRHRGGVALLTMAVAPWLGALVFLGLAALDIR